MSESKLRVTVVLPTRNRDEHAAACVESILANAGFEELIVVDQSEGVATETALSKFSDPRLRYVRSDTRGVTASRNLGTDLGHGDIIAFTDDDCRVAPDWIASMVGVFAADPDAAVVCGRVWVPEAIRQQGFAESFEPEQREWSGRYPPFGRDWGITANLALRRSVIDRVGKFDPLLGAGSPLRSGGEPDLLFRILRAGYKIVNAREVQVMHLGVRKPGKESSRLMRGYGTGTGAAFFKHVRLGDSDAVRVYLGFVGANVSRIMTSLLRGERPRGMGYLVSFLSGSLKSYRFAIDREQKLYVARSSSTRGR